MSVPVWVLGAVIGGLLGLVQGFWVRQLMVRNAQATGGAVPALARFIIPMEVVALAIAGGFIAHFVFGGS